MRVLPLLGLRGVARALRSTDDSLVNIAATVGYTSPTAFAMTFRRHLGVSPGAYRQRGRVEGGSGHKIGAAVL